MDKSSEFVCGGGRKVSKHPVHSCTFTYGGYFYLNKEHDICITGLNFFPDAKVVEKDNRLHLKNNVAKIPSCLS